MSNNGAMICKRKNLSFINKCVMSLLYSLMLLVIIPCSYLIFSYWFEMPIFIKIFWPMLLAIILVGMIITVLNGMIITKKKNRGPVSRVLYR